MGCVMSVLLYGLEGIVLRQSLAQRVDYFHTKALRNILRIEAAYMSRISNKEVVEEANNVLYCDRNANRYLIASLQIRYRAITFLGHIIREPNVLDHTKRLTITSTLSRVGRSYKRVGRPRFYWLMETRSKAYQLRRTKKKLTKQEFNIKRAQHRREVEKAAINRQFPFNKRKRGNKSKKKKGDFYGYGDHYKYKGPSGLNESGPSEYASEAGPAGYNETGPSGYNNAGPKTHSEAGPSGYRAEDPSGYRGGGPSGNRPGGASGYRAEGPSGHRENADAANEQEKSRRIKNTLRNFGNSFKMLGIPPTTRIEKIRKSYKKKALQKHPDKGGSNSEFRMLKEAVDKIQRDVFDLISRYPEGLE